MVGDSFTFGAARESESQPRQLERVLNAGAGARYEVINLGVPGYNTEQELLFFRAKGRVLAPDAVIVAFTLSDAELGFLGLYRSEYPRLIRLKEFLKSHVGMYLWAKQILLEVRVRRAHAAAKAWPMMAPLLDAAEGRPSPGWQRCRAALAAFGAECGSRGVPCVLVIWPVLERLGDYPYEHLHTFIRAQAEGLGFHVTDLLPTFAGRDAARLRVSPKDLHPNAEAHGLAAATIAEGLRPMLDAR
jgi:lysophospholipase L1-like esterase